MLSDERYKQLMNQVGMPDSHSLFIALKQVENESNQELKSYVIQLEKKN